MARDLGDDLRLEASLQVQNRINCELGHWQQVSDIADELELLGTARVARLAFVARNTALLNGPWSLAGLRTLLAGRPAPVTDHERIWQQITELTVLAAEESPMTHAGDRGAGCGGQGDRPDLVVWARINIGIAHQLLGELDAAIDELVPGPSRPWPPTRGRGVRRDVRRTGGQPDAGARGPR